MSRRTPRLKTPAAPAWLAPALLLAALGAALAATAWLRPIDGDEGYYAAAAQLTARGARPYADYFYPQAPLLPWLYAPAAAVGGGSLRVLRLVSALLVLATAAVWARHLLRERAGEGAAGPAAWAALAVLVCSPDLLSWGVTVKTYALTGLLATMALVGLERGLTATARAGAWLAAAGLALGLAGGARLFFAPLGPVAAAGLVLWPGAGGRRAAWAAAGWLLGGWLLGSAPLLAAWLQDPAVFAFNNLGYHTLRFSELRDSHPDPSWLRRAAASLAGTVRILAVNPYLLGFLGLAAAGATTLRRRSGAARRFLAVNGLLTAVFFGACMLPDPVYDQYFTAPLATLALPLAAAGLERVVGASARRAGLAAVAALLLGAGVLGLLRPGMDRDPVWSFASYDAVVADLRARTGPDDVILSFWPGYVFGAERRHLPGMENQFGVGVSEDLSPEQLVRFRIADRRRLMAALAAGEPRVVVLGTWMNEINTALDDPQMRELLAVFHAHYTLAALRDPVQICVPRAGP